ncbi:hypothetical protein H1C71_014964, partial [Ictidomys tridecemlineatus]
LPGHLCGVSQEPPSPAFIDGNVSLVHSLSESFLFGVGQRKKENHGRGLRLPHMTAILTVPDVVRPVVWEVGQSTALSVPRVANGLKANCACGMRRTLALAMTPYEGGLLKNLHSAESSRALPWTYSPATRVRQSRMQPGQNGHME